MKEIEPYKEENQDFIEAELLNPSREGYSSSRKERNSLFSDLLTKSGKLILLIFLLPAIALIILGAILSATVIGAIIGIPMILLGIIVIIIGLRIYFTVFSISKKNFRM